MLELFFVISGFYMELILSNGYSKKMNFYLSRFFRLWPLFFTIFLGYLLFDLLFVHLAHKEQMVSYARMNSSGNIFITVAAWISNMFMIGQDVFSWFYISPTGNINFFMLHFLKVLISMAMVGVES